MYILVYTVLYTVSLTFCSTDEHNERIIGAVCGLGASQEGLDEEAEGLFSDLDIEIDFDHYMNDDDIKQVLIGLMLLHVL